ncbi:MAG TPA: flagellar hook protein FlgE [Chloroflexota bacterium]|jgi:flagellar hook protein FlgE|nr:flagellar hook protein FlgE [Chloroflexota bacterium]
MFAAVQALRNHQTFMDVVANNIANVNTTGFKSGRIDFQDVLNQTLRGAVAPSTARGGVNPVQVGLGVGIAAIDNFQTQGDLQSTGRVTDLAIQGDGYFQLSDGQQTIYSRDGSFDVGSDGKLVSPSTGLKVEGWQADETGLVDTGQPIGDITIPFGRMSPPLQTTQASIAGNLDARVAQGTSVSTVMKVFDSLGAPHNVDLLFVKQAGNSWDWQATTSDIGVLSGNPLAAGTITFDDAGLAQSPPGLPEGVMTLNFDFGGSTTVNIEMDNLTGFAQQSTVNVDEQNGHEAGALTSFTVGPDGSIQGIFSNGFNQTLGRIALARFKNPGGLTRSGSNSFQLSVNSGLPIIGGPGDTGLGTVNSGTLEMSNANLAQQFTDMIRAQRGFQANSRMITTSDELLQELIQLKR